VIPANEKLINVNLQQLIDAVLLFGETTPKTLLPFRYPAAELAAKRCNIYL